MPLQEFLQHGVYKLPHEALPEGVPRQTVDKFMRTMGRKPPGVPYVITSKAPDIRSNDWRRVVAVFVSGQTWQFKDWPHKASSAPVIRPFCSGSLQASLHAVSCCHCHCWDCVWTVGPAPTPCVAVSAVSEHSGVSCKLP